MVGGPGHLRFFLQPAIAVLFGVLHGVRDARAGRAPYFADVVAARGSRLRLLNEGLHEIAIPLCVAILGAFTFQYIIRGHIYFAYGVLYAALFVALPYVATRGLANRAARAALNGRSRTAGPRRPG
jgi:hypothetical protein